MPDKHLSSQFDSELNSVSARVMEMGGLVESQIRQAVYALSQFSLEAVDTVASMETRINAMEVEIDQELSSIIARRQPAAGLLQGHGQSGAHGRRSQQDGAHGALHH